MTANPVDLIGGLATTGNVVKADISSWAKARVAQVLADATEVRNTVLALQLVIFVKALRATYRMDTTDTTTTDDGVSCIISSDGFRFKAISSVPAPTLVSLGGVFASVAVAHQFLTGLDTSGNLLRAQPAAADLSDGVTGSGAVVLATGATLVTPTTAVLSGGSAAGSSLTLRSTSNGSPSGDSANLYGSTVTIGNANNAASVINLNGASGGGVTVNIAASGNGLNALNVFNSVGGKQVWVPGSGTGTTPGTITFPSGTGTLATLAGPEALTNKTVNGNAISASSGTLTLGAGKTLIVNNSLALTGADGTTMTFPLTSATLARTDAGQTFTGVQVFTAPTINGGTHDGHTSFGIRSTGAAFDLKFASVEVLTANRTVTWALGDAAHTITLGAGNPTLTGSNTGDQTITLTGDVTGSGTGSFATTIAANAVTNAKMATSGAATLKGNPTNATANVTDFTIQGLTARGAPDAANDKIPIYDNAAGTIKYVTPSQVAGASSGTVTSIATGDGLSGGPITTSGTLSADFTTHLGFMSGLTLSTAGGTSTFAVAPGVAVDIAGGGVLKLTSGTFTKTTAAWAVGSANGSFDGTGAAPSATAGWYHVHLIKRTDTGVVDVLTSLSASAPTLPSPYTLFRRIGAMKTNGSFQWIGFVQFGNEFVWTTTVADASGLAVGTTPVSVSLTVPPGVIVWAKFTGLSIVPASAYTYFYSLDRGTQAAGSSNSSLVGIGASDQVGGDFTIRTNVSRQIGIVSSVAANSIFVNTYGWVENL